MAIPIGTTYRQLEAVGRWLLAGVVIIGMLVWWRPGYLAWGALTAALLLVWMLWLIWRTNAGDRHVPGHPFHLVILGPVAVLAWHLCRTGLAAKDFHFLAVAGGLNLSMIFQLALLSLGVMLVQSLLPRAAGHFGVLSVCGAAMMGGAAAAIAWGQVGPAKSAVALMGFAGVCVWLTPLWGVGETKAPSPAAHPLRRRELRILCVAAAAAGALMLTWVAPHEALLVCGVAGAATFLAGLVFQRRRSALLAAGGAVTVTAAVVARLARSSVMTLEWIPENLLGFGEDAFKHVTAADSGLEVLGRAVGWTGLIWLAAGMAACAVWLMWHAGRGHAGDQARAVVWTTATALASCALLAPAGLFIPSVTLAAALTWGLLPAMLGRTSRPRSGAVLVAALAVLLVFQGLARKAGLLLWEAAAFGYAEQLLHGGAGFALGMALAWYMGVRKVYLGLLGVALAVLAGAAGELAQGLVAGRGTELGDWLAHAVGAAAAVPLYLLSVGARWCESPEAKKKEDYADGAYGRG